MPESPWTMLAGGMPMAPGQSSDQTLDMQNAVDNTASGFSAPDINSILSGFQNPNQQSANIPGVAPGSNGYPQFQSPSDPYSNNGYVSGNPIDSTPSLIAMQGREAGMPGNGMQPQAPTQPSMNPWAIKQSSGQGDPFGYPLGPTQPPKINAL